MTEAKARESESAFTVGERKQLVSVGFTLTMPDEAEWQTADYREDKEGWVQDGHKLRCFCNDLGMVVVHHYFPVASTEESGAPPPVLSAILGQDAEAFRDLDTALAWLIAKKTEIQKSVRK